MAALACLACGGSAAAVNPPPAHSPGSSQTLRATPVASSQPVGLPRASAGVPLPVPYTTQAPLGDWMNHQESCEEAALAMVADYYRGGREQVIPPVEAEQEIENLVSWQIANWGHEDDLNNRRMAGLAAGDFHYGSRIFPADESRIQAELESGHPVIIGVRTHGLGNPRYPHYQDAFEDPRYSVPHYVVVVGFDGAGNFLLNDGGIEGGGHYLISYRQLLTAIDDLDQHYPQLNEGRVALVVGPGP